MAYKFQEMGRAMNKIAQKLNKNQSLCRLLKYMQSNPLSSDLKDWDSTVSLIGSNIRIIPKVRANEATEAFVIISIPEFELSDNEDFTSCLIAIDIICPMDKWNIDDICPRPYKIMDIIYDELQNSKVTGIGTLQFLSGNQTVIYEEVTDHQMIFQVIANG